MSKIKKITIIGAGCVGNFLSDELIKFGYEIIEVVSRSKAYAIELAERVGAQWTTDFNNINLESDLYILSVRDDAIQEIATKIDLGDKFLVHTSGSVPIKVLENSSNNYGVLYPLQTILKDRKLDITEIPFFVEANNETALKIIEEFAQSISRNVNRFDSAKRKVIHLAAVFASNFTNYLLKISKEILEKEEIDFAILEPLVFESIKKAFEIGPIKSQTGPAKRGDKEVIEKHIEMLDNMEWKKIYTLLSDRIFEEFKNYPKKEPHKPL